RIVSRTLRDRFEQARIRAGGHPGETGGSREEVLREFLRDTLPARFSIGSGFITDTSGSRSKQIDVIVNDDHVFRSFPYDKDKGLYFSEAVSALVSVKSTLTRAELG